MNLSATQIEMFLRCPEQWRRRYVEGERRPPGIAAHLGTGVHAGAAAEWGEKIKNQKSISVSEFESVAVDTLERRIAEDDFMPDPDVGSKEKELDAAKKSVLPVAAHFLSAISPLVKPKLIEKSIKIEGGNYSLSGRLDLVTEDDRVLDLKTGAKLKNADDVNQSLQLTHYAMMAKIELGRDSFDVGLISLRTKNPESKFLWGRRTLADMQIYLRTVDAVIAMIKAGTFIPTSPANWWCGERWCGYWRDCKFRK